MVLRCRARVSLTFLIALSSCGGLARAAAESDAGRVSQVLSAAKDLAAELKSDLETMDFFAGSQSAWESHASIVNIYNDHVNAIRGQVAKLDSARNIASPVQKTTIDRIVPLMQEMAADTEALIKQINQNPKGLNGGEFRDYIKANADLAAELSTLIAGFVAYATTQQQLDRLKRQLNPTPGTL
jgi:hypothetical protein